MNASHIVHLYNLAHYNPLNPISAKHSLVSDYVAYSNGLTYPPADKHCDKCGVYLIPGLTCSSKIAYKKPKVKRGSSEVGAGQKAKRSRMLYVTCLACQYTKKLDNLLNERVSKPYTMAAVTGPNISKKKKERSELSMLMAAKKSKQQGNAKTLSLQEFMQL